MDIYGFSGRDGTMNSKNFQNVIREKAIKARDQKAIKDVETLGELAQKIADYGKENHVKVILTTYHDGSFQMHFGEDTPNEYRLVNGSDGEAALIRRIINERTIMEQKIEEYGDYEIINRSFRREL